MSYWDTQHNYGQVLQCYAMQQFLRNLGHTPYHIKYTPEPTSTFGKISKLLKSIAAGDTKELIRQRRNSQKHNGGETLPTQRNFDEFRKRHITFTDRTYTYKSLRQLPPEADCYIAGSDQIWASPDPGYMLNFGNKNTLRIAYAPSMGGIAMMDGHMRYDFRRLIKRLDVVTAREQDGVEQCHAAGRKDAELVPDPVMLLRADEYRNIASSPRPERPYILLYLLGNQIDIDVHTFFEWADRHNLDIKYITAQGRNDSYPKAYPNVDEWLGLIDGAKYVFTNSFHGMLTSIILNRPFLTIPLSGSYSRMNSRITTLLTSLSLTDRIFRNSLDEVERPIDFAKVNERLAEARKAIADKFGKWLSPAK